MMDDLDKLIQSLRQSGWATVTRSKGGHWKIHPADKSKSVIVAPFSPSDYRALKNLRSRLKREGFQQ